MVAVVAMAAMPQNTLKLCCGVPKLARPLASGATRDSLEQHMKLSAVVAMPEIFDVRKS